MNGRGGGEDDFLSLAIVFARGTLVGSKIIKISSKRKNRIANFLNDI
jgi:hypothetical protein